MRRFEPLPENRRPPQPLAVVASGLGSIMVADETGRHTADNVADSVELLQRYRRHRVFTVGKPRDLVAHLGGEHFTGTRTSGGGTPKVKLDNGPTISGAYRDPLQGLNAREAYEELSGLAEWLAERRIHLGSRGHTAFQGWRGTLEAPITIKNPVGGKHLMGGRKGAPYIGTFGECYYVDIRAAYLSAMAGLFPTQLQMDPSKSLDHPIGAALARVEVPESAGVWTPLAEPTKIGPEWRTGEMRGWWTLGELRNAADHGVRIIAIEAVMAGKRYRNIFGRWLDEIAMPMRALPGRQGRLGKTITGALWGMFSMSHPSKSVRYEPGHGFPPRVSVSRRVGTPPTDGAMWSAEIASRVRVRIMNELVPSEPIYIDTDGGVIRAGSKLPSPIGDSIGEWAIKERMRTFTARGIGAYKWDSHGGETNVTLAGVEKATVQMVDQYGGAEWDGHRATFLPKRSKLQDPWCWDLTTLGPIPLHRSHWGEPVPPWRFAINPEFAGMNDLRVSAELSGIPPEQWPPMIDKLPRTLPAWERMRRERETV